MKKVFDTAWKSMKDRNWEKIYLLVDVHGVIMHSNYCGDSDKIYMECIDPLRIMSADPRFCLIMWSCSSPESGKRYREIFKRYGIKFDYYNENPEVDNSNGYGDYSKKLYCNCLLDDKAGFDPAIHWNQINEWLIENL